MDGGPILWGGVAGGLEIRRKSNGGAELHGRFPYNRPATLSDGGRRNRPRKELIIDGGFNYRVDKADEDIHLLVGHDYNRPLASKGTDTLFFRRVDGALEFVARIRPEIHGTVYGQTAMAQIESGLMTGISPGFRIPPERAVPDAEEIVDEGTDVSKGMHNAIIRKIKHALLYEFSIVTRPAYPEAQIEARSWDLTSPPSLYTDEALAGLARLHQGIARWRA